MTEATAAPARVIRLRELEALTGRKRSSIYEDVAQGRLPRQVKIGPRAVGWLKSDIDQWLAALVAARDASPVTNTAAAFEGSKA